MSQTEQKQLALGGVLAYSFPVGVVAYLLLPALTLIPDIYPRFFGLRFSTVAAATFCVGIAGAIANPVVGLFSDRYRVRGGSRRACVIVALILFVLASYQLLVPPRQLTASYFIFWYVATTVTWICFDLPHLAWGGELAHDYHARTRLFGIRCFAVSLGTALFYGAALCRGQSAQITPDTLRFAAAAGLVMALPAIYCALKYVPGGVLVRSATPETFRDTVAVISRNRPFLLLVAICIALGVAQGLWVALSAVVFDYYFGVGQKLSVMYLGSAAVTAVTLPLMIRLAAWLGKKYTFALVQIGFVALISVPMGLTPAVASYLPLTVVLVGVNIVVIFNNVITNAILADTVDYGRWKYGKGQAASYFAAFNFLVSMATLCAGPVGFSVIERFGFEPQGIVDMERARWGIYLVFFVLPALMAAVGIGLILRLPLSKRRAETIRKRLAARSRSAAALESQVGARGG
jgi:glycoside/pentoside/hexuronide:cation symporter, GPH family